MRRWLLGAAIVLGSTACAGPDPGWDFAWSDSSTPLAGADAVAVGSGIEVRFGPRCGQLTIEDSGLRTGCLGVSSGASMVVPLRAGDLRIVWIVRTGGTDEERGVDHAVAWSSASPEGKQIEAITLGGIEQVVWVMRPGEEPWGMQLIDARRRLVAVHDLVGLPGS